MQIKYPRNSCTPLEGFVVQSNYNSEEAQYTVRSNFQGPFSLHSVITRSLNVSENKLRLISNQDSGGSFGIKQAILPMIVLTCLASRLSGKNVKWIEDRIEHLTAASSATNRVTNIKAAVKKNGKILALDYDQIDDVGAYLRAPEPASLYRMHGNLSGPYLIDDIFCRNRVVLTNKTPTGLNRGFGGKCLPKDSLALGVLADELGCKYEWMDAMQKDNLRLRQTLTGKPSDVITNDD